MEIVADSGPIVSFARARLPELLNQVVGTLIVPDAVYEEIAIRGAGKAGSGAPQWIRRRSLGERGELDEVSATFRRGGRETPSSFTFGVSLSAFGCT